MEIVILSAVPDRSAYLETKNGRPHLLYRATEITTEPHSQPERFSHTLQNDGTRIYATGEARRRRSSPQAPPEGRWRQGGGLASEVENDIKETNYSSRISQVRQWTGKTG